MIQTGVKPLQMEEEKFRYDTITDAVSDAAAEKLLLLQCPIPTPGQIQIWLLSGWKDINCSERGDKSLQCTNLPPLHSTNSLSAVFSAALSEADSPCCRGGQGGSLHCSGGLAAL